MDRKAFVKLISAGALCGGTVSFLEGCIAYRYADFTREGNKLIIEKAAFQEDFFVLVRNPQGNSPIYLRKNPDGIFTALLLECTHKQCTVNPAGEALSCPCHGSRFDSGGEVLEGPARRALFRYVVNADSQNIYIQLPN